MNKTLARLEALFGAEDFPADPTGILARVAQGFAASELQTIAVGSESGELIAFHSSAGDTWGRDELQDALHQLGPDKLGDPFLHTWLDASGCVRVATRSSIQNRRFVLLARFGAFDAQSEKETSAFSAAAEIMLRAIAAAKDNSELSSRVVHLRNEQEMLAASHQQVVADLIETREEQVRKEREYAAVLESEVAKRSEQLRLARRQAQLGSLARGAFLAGMGQEIRTSLTTVLGYADLLLDGEASKEEVIESAQVIRKDGERILQILNDVLEISRIESNKITIEKMACDPRRILDDAAAALQSSAAERGVELETRIERGVPSMVTTDPMRVTQILVNLIAHAVRSSEAGAVRLNVRHESRANGKFLEIDVVDSGLGMSEEQLTKIFQPFSPADSSMRRRFGGTGLGLFISKSLTELLGGSLFASSSPGAGSTFHLSLPLADFTGSFAAKVER